ncbi:monocarboxylate transporter 10-like [Acropora millepora]|uniref:monocarboxylate transporter 10-like n=1 Tax=Acropora millepora TaxID=45264 RepID=UPI001CF4549B|nr:monocarboxylate transporter 10-like [Acropora millepora]
MGRNREEIKESEKGEVQTLVDRSDVPEGGWGWCVCLAGFIAQFVVLGLQNNTGILYKTLLTEFKSNKGETAWVLSIGLGMMFMFAPVSSALSERVGCRAVAFVGGLLGVLGFVSSSFVTNVHLLYGTFGILWGIGASMSYLPTLRSLPYWFSRRIGLANGIVTAGSGVGTIAMGPIMQLAVNRLGWANSTRVLAGMLSLCTIGSLLYRVPNQNNKTAEKAEREEKPQRPPIFDISVFCNKAFLVWCISLSTFMMGYFVPFVHLPAYAEECGIPNSQSSTLVGMMSVGSTFGRLIFGKLGDHPKVNRLYCFQTAMLVIGVADTLSTLTKSYAGLVVYMVVFGVFDGCFVVFLAVLCADIVGVDKVSAGIGVQFFFMAITSIAGPPVAGIIYELSQSYQIAFYVAGACSTVATCLLFLVPILMPPELCDNSRGRAETVCSKDSEKPLIRIQSPDSSEPVSSSKASLDRSCRKLNSTLHLSPSQSYLNRYCDIPKRTSMRASMASLLSFGPIQPAKGEVLLVVERVSQV